MAFNVQQHATQYGIPMKLANALIGQESGGRTNAVSPAGATGLTQVMPSTAAGMYGISEAEAKRRLMDPTFALDAGFRYLRRQKDTFGTWRLALAAYNAGPNAVRKYGGVPPYVETQNYVKNILAKAGALSPTQPQPGQPVLPGAPQEPTQTAPAINAAQQSSMAGLQQLASGRFDPTEQLSLLAQFRTSERALAAAPQIVRELPVEIEGPATKRDMGAVALAKTYLGTPYVWGGEQPGGFDCSGLLQYVWGRQGVEIPRVTYDQIKAGRAVSRGQLRPGDAVFFGTEADPHHVGMYIGGGKFIEAPRTGLNVRISKLAGRDDYIGARRFGGRRNGR